MGRLLQQALWALSEREVIHGYPIGLSLDDEHFVPVRARLYGAFNLLAATQPRWLRRMRSYVLRIQVRRVVEANGLWQRESRQVDLDTDYLLRSQITDIAIASTLIHEFTHARIEAAGILYANPHRIRIEQACVSEQLRFLRSLPPTPDVLALIEVQAGVRADAAVHWGEEAIERRKRRMASALGLPKWVMDILYKVRRWRRGAARAA